MAFSQVDTNVLDAENSVLIKTNYGDIKVRLFTDKAPKTVENFVTHAKNGYYDGQIFHRIIKDFMIQGGDPTGTGMGGESIWDKDFEDEFHEGLFNFRGALSMANRGPNTNGSQFFIVEASRVPSTMLGQLESAGYPEEIIEKYAELGGAPWLDNRHTVFGQVIEGMDIVDKIASVETGAMDKPVEDVKIETIEVQ